MAVDSSPPTPTDPSGAPEPAPTGRTTDLRLPFRAGLVLLALAIVAAVVLVARSNGPAPVASATDKDVGFAVGAAQATLPPAPTTTRKAPSLTAAPTTETTLPLPDPLPRDPYAPTPRVVMASLTIPRIGLKVQLLEGVTLTSIDQGTGHWPGTPAPGGLGNMVIAGHRTIKQRPFYRLNELQPGDAVVFDSTDGHRYTYQVRGTIIVPAASIGIISQSDAHTATLFACNPIGQATQRIVVKLRLLDDKGKPVDPDSALPPMDVGNRPIDGTALVRDTSQSDPDTAPDAGADPLAAPEK